jgi:hypothetical protein
MCAFVGTIIAHTIPTFRTVAVFATDLQTVSTNSPPSQLCHDCRRPKPHTVHWPLPSHREIKKKKFSHGRHNLTVSRSLHPPPQKNYPNRSSTFLETLPPRSTWWPSIQVPRSNTLRGNRSTGSELRDGYIHIMAISHERHITYITSITYFRPP